MWPRSLPVMRGKCACTHEMATHKSLRIAKGRPRVFTLAAETTAYQKGESPPLKHGDNSGWQNWVHYSSYKHGVTGLIRLLS